MGIMPCVTSVKWGSSSEMIKKEVTPAVLEPGPEEVSPGVRGSPGTQPQKRCVKIGSAAEKCSKCSLYLP